MKCYLTYGAWKYDGTKTPPTIKQLGYYEGNRSAAKNETV